MAVLSFGLGEELMELCRLLRIIRRYNAAGIPIKRAIELHIEAIEDGKMKNNLREILKELNKGEQFSSALKKQGIFDRYVYELISVGENTGNLGDVLNQLVFKMTNDLEVNRAVNSGLRQIYMFVAFFLAAFVYTILVVLPSSQTFLASIGTKLPAATQLIFDFGTLCQHYWYIFLVVIVGSGVYIVQLAKRYPETIENIKLKMPYIGALYKKQLHYQFCKVFEICLKAGFPAQKALQYTASAVNNHKLKSNLLVAIKNLGERGFDLSEALKKSDKEQFIDLGLYPVLQAGVTSGTLDVVLAEEADEYKKEVLDKAQKLGNNIGSIVVTPLVFLILAFVVLVVGLPMKEALEAASNYGY